LKNNEGDTFFDNLFKVLMKNFWFQNHKVLTYLCNYGMKKLSLHDGTFLALDQPKFKRFSDKVV